MALQGIVEVLKRMRENTQKLSAEAQKRIAEQQKKTAPAAPKGRPRYNIITMGASVRGSMGKTFHSCR